MQEENKECSSFEKIKSKMEKVLRPDQILNTKYESQNYYKKEHEAKMDIKKNEERKQNIG